jgi:hypothetical protein
MKTCPKCNSNHSLAGTFCSRKCANSRTFSNESKLKKSAANKQWYNQLSEDEKNKNTDVKRKVNQNPQKRQKARESQLDKRSWEEFSWPTKRRLVIEEQKNCCSKCGIDNWQGFPLTLEVDHIDGDRKNNTRSNLEGLCPNCHSLTDTWRGRNKTGSSKEKVQDEVLLKALLESKNINQGLLKAGLAVTKRSYNRAKKLLSP